MVAFRDSKTLITVYHVQNAPTENMENNRCKYGT